MSSGVLGIQEDVVRETFREDLACGETAVFDETAPVEEWGLSVLQKTAEWDNLMAMSQATKGAEVVDVLRRIVDELGSDDAFYVVDLGTVVRKLVDWKRLLPRVTPCYAIKCNPDPMVMRILAAAGVGFDCASKGEIDAVLALDVSADRIIFANPCKQVSALKHAHEKGVLKMTFDNAEELCKIARVYPSAQLVLRIAVDDSQSICRFNTKFGARADDHAALLSKAIELGLDVMGVSFHVGSGCLSVESFVDAVRRARAVFDLAESLGLNLTLLDIGGGFPGHNTGSLSFEDIGSAITTALDQFFPPTAGFSIIAEPGRYFVSESHTVAVNVLAKKSLPADAAVEGPNVAYYVSDGVYGSFNCIMFDHAVVEPKPLEKKSSDVKPSKIFGPTCDSIDCINQLVDLPELSIGDWMYFENMGAYTRSAASAFNGFRVPPSFYVNMSKFA